MLLEPYSLVSIATRSFLLLLLTAGIAIACRRCSAAVLHGIWTVGLGACLATPVLILLSPSWALPLLPAQERPTVGIPVVQRLGETQHPATAAHVPIGNEHPSANHPPTVADQAVTTPPVSQAEPSGLEASSAVITSPVKVPSRRSMAFYIWMMGLSVILFRLMHQTLAVHRKVAQASDFDDAQWRQLRDIAAQRLGVRTELSLKRHSEALSPMVVGALRPVLLLPDDAADWPHERRNLVLLHELSHVQRCDVLTQLMATLACAIYWFNPLVWWGAFEMKRLREIACDDAVITHSGAAATYAQTLLDVAKRYRCPAMPNAVPMARSSHVEGRIAAILNSTRSRVMLGKRLVRVFVAVALVLAVFFGTCRLTSWADDVPEQEAAKAGNATSGESETSVMAVQVVNEEGEPLSDVHLHFNMAGMKEVRNNHYTTDEQGHVEIERPRRLGLMRIWIAKQGYVPQFLNFESGSDEQGPAIPEAFEFQLKKGHRLRGRVVDEEGNPISNVKVEVRVEVEEPNWKLNPGPMISTWLTSSTFNSPAPLTDADGRWSIENAPGPPQQGKDFEFRLLLTHSDFAGDTRWGELQRQQGITTADLRSGEATLTLDRGIAITGQVTGPDGKPVAQGLVIWDARPYWATGVNETPIDEAGRYKTKHLAPGSYPITVLAPGFAPWQQTIELTQDFGDLDIQLQSGNSIEIKFVDQDGHPIPNVYVGIGDWRGTEAIYNEIHSNVPESGVPWRADSDGVYRWDWAPNDAVGYSFRASGFARQEASLVAKSTPHVITLAPQRVVVGRVTDAATGMPIEIFDVMPVIVFRPDFYHTRTTDAKVGRDGEYELPLIGSGDPNSHYRVRFEADGYRSVVSEDSFDPLAGRATLDIALQPASPREGRVVDADGRPVERAMIVQASPTEVPNTSNGQPESYDTRSTFTDTEGRFALRATTEDVRVRVYHDLGFAEQAIAPDTEEIGVLQLKPWASVSGRLVQAEQPIAGQSIYFHPLASRGLTEARFQDSYHAQTDAEGRFQFDRIAPTSGTLKAYLGPWQESPLTSSESVPLELAPGEHREVILGGGGATITGRVVATGRSNEELSKQWSLNYLVSRNRGVDYPEDATPLSFDASGNLQAAWLRQPDFQSWVATRLNYFVKLSDEGGLAIHGVDPGEYDLVLQLYEQPAGCLVETIGEKVVPITVTASQTAAGQLEIGDIDVQCRIGPRVGSDMRAFKVTDARGRVRLIDDLQGQYVLLHVWAAWCAPCIKSLPTLKATVGQHADSPLTVVGLNVDEDIAAAKAMAEAQQLDWAQNYLGPDSDLMRQLAVSSVPAYYLIGPDGKLVGSASQWEQIEPLLSSKLDE